MLDGYRRRPAVFAGILLRVLRTVLPVPHGYSRGLRHGANRHRHFRRVPFRLPDKPANPVPGGGNDGGATTLEIRPSEQRARLNWTAAHGVGANDEWEIGHHGIRHG